VAWDDDLTSEQRTFASDAASRRRLVAGPGTGKTRVMTRRVAYLIEEEIVEPSRILALTFSRAAARELRERLEALIGDAGDRPLVSTLHSFALRQLVRNAGAPTLPSPIRIADDYDERWVIQEEIAALTDMTVRQVQREFRNLAADWETLAADEDVWERQHPVPQFLGAWRRHREIYGYTLRAELVYALKKALEQDPDFDLERDFEHVLVDEYQDLNRCEIDVIRRIVGDTLNIFAAGDDDQSIYGFRNAFPLGLREFGETYEGVIEGELVECHRCDREILRLALAVAEQDPDRIAKDLRPRDDAEDGDVQVFGFRNGDHEAAGIARICRTLVDDEGVDPGSILILLRSDPGGVYSQPLIAALDREGLDAEVRSNPFAILTTDTARQVVCLLRLLEERADGLAWRELLKLRHNGIGDGTLFSVYRLADERGQRYTRTLQDIAQHPDLLDSRMRNRLAEDIEEINHLLDELTAAFELPADQGLDEVLDAVGLESEERDAVTDLLVGLVGEDEEATLSTLARALQSTQGSRDEEGQQAADRIRVMSMHAAKGLTADAVIIAACEDELIPGADLDRRELDDQRRLLYVSLSRARRYLMITFAAYRPGQQSHRLQVPPRRTFTRFLRDYIDPQLV
jgi:DNA helicase II / ATP-dependent DNA helicase PcrA